MSKETDPVKLVEGINAAIGKMQEESKTVTAELKKSVEATTGKAEDALAKSGDAIKAANESAEKIVAIAGEMKEMQQALAEGVKRGTASPKSLGDIIIKSEEFAAFASGKSQKFRIEANTIIGQSGSPPANSNTLVQPDRQAGIVPGPFRNLKIADFIPQGNTSSNMVEYTRELAFTNAAAETAEGDTKPQSTLTFELVQAPVKTIAHFLKASKQILDDAPALASYIDLRMRYGVDLRFEQQIIAGNGTGQNLSGLTKSGNYTLFTPTSGETSLDSVNRMIEAVETTDYSPTAVLMNTADWHGIERQKVGGTSNPNQYVVGDPLGVLTRTLWGLPVVVSNSMTPGRAMVANFDIAYQIFNRQSTVVEMFEQDDTNVQKNLITIRAERRAALAIERPASSVYGLVVFGSSH